MSAALLDLVRADRAVANLRTYFREDAPLPYTGRRFESLDGGGDRPDNRDVVTGSDLIAVQMLSVKFTVEQNLVQGRPTPAFIAQSHQAQMVVVGARGHGGFTGLLLGSVGHALLHHADCPVAVVRPADTH